MPFRHRAHLRYWILAGLAVLVGLGLHAWSVQASLGYCSPPLCLNWISQESDWTYGVAWGDVDGDGDLDLAVGNYGVSNSPNRVYRNDGGQLAAVPMWSSATSDNATSLAWGDVDGDGDLDLAVGAFNFPNKLYRNNGGILTDYSVYTSTESDKTYSVAWGDVDGDGDLDLAVGNSNQPNRLYRNDSGVLSASAVYSTTESDNTTSVAWGDVDGDGDLDLAVGNANQPNKVYRNDGGALTLSAVYSTTESDPTTSVAWNDYDGDGDLDLVVGNDGQPNRVYRNDNGVLTPSAAWSAPFTSQTTSLAWGDYNGDGSLDLAIGNRYQPKQVYAAENPALRSRATYSTTESDNTASIAWGDYDGDGDLDLAAGNGNGQPSRLYRNDNGTLTASAVYSTAEAGNTTSVAWGDVDGDGDLDLAAGNFGQPLRLYRNTAGALSPGAFWTSTENDYVTSVAWGDYDGDGDLDLAAGLYNPFTAQPDRLYRNTNGVLSASAVWSTTEKSNTTSVAWGDVDGDGDLDLAVGNFQQPNRLYLNDRGVLNPTAAWATAESDDTNSLAWGDYDGDGDLDLAVGNGNGQASSPNRLYRNDQGTLTSSAVWSSLESDNTKSIAWADVDGDGDLDLAVGNYQGPSRIYRNDHGVLTSSAVWSTETSAFTSGLAWGDVNGDGSLDLALANFFEPNRLYLNTGGFGTPFGMIPRVKLAWPNPLVNANFSYTNPAVRSAVIPLSFTLTSTNGLPVRSIAASYSPDGGGQWFPAIATSGTLTTNLATTGTVVAATNSAAAPILDVATITSTFILTPAGSIADVNVALNISHTWDSDLVISLVAPSGHGVLLVNLRGGNGDNFTSTVLDDEAGTSIAAGAPPFAGSFRPEQPLSTLDNEAFQGLWSLVITDTGVGDVGTLVSWGLTVTARPTYTYLWDTFASGFFGQSDNMVIRIEAVPSLKPTANSAPQYLRPHTASATVPFRARGTQIRVMSDTVPVANALVYRLPVGQTTGALPISTLNGIPFRTDNQGYLQGSGQIAVGDQLLALAPVSATSTYSLYFTNGTPTPVSVTGTAVAQSGVQTLTVSAAHPLYIFNLEVALEWDSSRDSKYLDQLRFNLQRASDYLYDFTDGQAALGSLTVVQNADDWGYANVLIRATNRLRPYAIQGGIVTTPTVDPQHQTLSDTITYDPGQVTMGSTWNRYGAPGQNLGDDWPIILAHELSHYLFFQDDTYLGLDAQGHLIAVNTCKGSAMGDVYTDPSATEFIGDESYWQTHCQQTLPEKTLGRNEWDTLRLWYPALQAPVALNANPGPSLMPFDFTQIQVLNPLTPTQALEDPTFYLNYSGGGVSTNEARAFLLRNNQFVIDLGSPIGGQNRVIARGAQPNDTLCVFDRPVAQFGCEAIALGDDQLALKQVLTWTPVVQISPVNSTTLNLQVSTLPSGLALQARLFPEFGTGSTPITLTRVGAIYSGTLILTAPALTGHLQVWVNEPATETDPRRETIVPFSIGGNPGIARGGGGIARGGGGIARGGGGIARGGGGIARGGGGIARGGGAPLLSPDGQMTFFTANPIDFPVGEFYAIQGMGALPSMPAGRVVIGQSYSLFSTPGAPVLTGSVSVQYLSNDVIVAGAEETQLLLYFYNGTQWKELDTIRDTYFNLLSAPSQGTGIYAVMASIQLPLKAAGWNLVAYPLLSSQPVTQALLSISGYYTTVYGYHAEDLADPWKVYDIGAPAYVNDLLTLDYGQGYWINARQPITLYLAPALPSVTGPALPPSTFYGPILGNAAFTPAAGQTLTAWVDGVQCGQTVTQLYQGQVVFAADVVAEGNAALGCGAPGRTVIFRIGTQRLAPEAPWDNNQLHAVTLTPAYPLYLPLVKR